MYHHHLTIANPSTIALTTSSSLTILILILFLPFSTAIPTHARPPPTTSSPTITTTTTPTHPSVTPEFTSPSLFTSAILNSTNHFRTSHNATALTYNTTLARSADTFLDSNPSCEFRHSGGPYGENIALGCSNVTSCVEMWGNERDEYDFRKAEFDKKTGHFTQLVWKGTTDVGCGRRWCSGGWFLVCEYWPRGNVAGKFGEEVQSFGSRLGSGFGFWWVVIGALIVML
ncbi:hypothetical protein OQA88_9276 [Cercophora sp. LCS_1]